MMACSSIRGVTNAVATSRPGKQYGATVAKAEQVQISTQEESLDYGGVAMTTAARAEAGQGVTVALARANGETKQAGVTSEVRSRANAARWYMSPGHAVSGAINIGHGGRVSAYTENRARSSLGTAQGGLLARSIATGDFSGKYGGPGLADQADYTSIQSVTDQKVDNDAGNAAAGYVQLARAYDETVQLVNNPGAAAATAVGNAVAGGISIALSDHGAAFIGDYDNEFDTYENDVAGM
eukprot:GHUV01048250.1.p1 GENE.GHUV01048250.1~~GHUV01048250.1.p1  ORF type:complete len:239 (+),score=26.42 GHUV01048250.1:650-1366(+)